MRLLAVLFTFLIGLLPFSVVAEVVEVDFDTARLTLYTDKGEPIADFPVVLPKKSYLPSGYPVTGRVVGVIKNPSWSPTASTRRDHLKKTGKTLPKVVQPGKNNPMGAYKFTIAFDPGESGRLLVDPAVKIHGTNKPSLFKLPDDKRFLSRGCVRMLNPNITELAGLIEGKPVTVRFVKGDEGAKNKEVVPPPTDQVIAGDVATQAQSQ